MKVICITATLLFAPCAEPMMEAAEDEDSVEVGDGVVPVSVGHQDMLAHGHGPSIEEWDSETLESWDSSSLESAPPPIEPRRKATPGAFSFGFMRRALVAGILAGAICSWLGILVLLNRVIFVGVALAEVALGAVAAAVYFALPVLPVALLLTLAASLLIGLLPSRRGSFSPSERIAFAYLLGGAMAYILLSRSGAGEAEQLALVQGSLLAVQTPRVVVLLMFVLLLVFVHRRHFRRLVWVSFDPTYAQLLGTSITRYRMLFYLLLGAGISLTIQTCGVLLVFGYLILPPALGFALGLRLPGVLIGSQVAQIFSTFTGLWIAYHADLPAGSAIVVVLLVGLAGVPLVVRQVERLRAAR